MTVEELANKRYGGEFVFMLGHLEGVTRFVFECFDPRPDHGRKSGSFNIRDFNGENSKDVSRKKFKLIRGKRHPIILK